MSNLIKRFFSTKESSNTNNEFQKFELLKYDGIRAINLNKPQRAIECFKKANDIMKDMETESMLAKTYKECDMFDAAQKIYEQMAIDFPNSPESYYQLATIAFDIHKYNETIEYANKAIGINAQMYDAYIISGKAYHRQKNYIMSIATLTQAIAINNENTDGYLCRAKVLLSMSQYKECMDDINKVISFEENNEQAYIIKGDICTLTQQTDEAKKCYKTAMMLNPYNSTSSLKLCKLMIDLHQYEESMTIIGDTISNTPSCAEAYILRGRIKMETKDEEGAIQDMKKAIEINPQITNNTFGQFSNMD